ncbi:conserved hypothetical protein [Histoplasma capsulatum var. duboisii H88]|uniref:Proteophosphoglycan 5 n=1 Tax=Ajellomyces capsulatus (strain H88) TaxID=544711 RepID=F0UG86_AJEC8|nr:conserved hypothetical protein [Histoplasma capsulatum var. duboisii H88]QSS55848.1 hypothetical protein I7I53_03844 [Histoplasma capsulatum var. duboisii H88]
MSTPIPTTPKGPRNPRRNRKNSKAGTPANNAFRSGPSNQKLKHFTPTPSRSSPPSPSPGEASNTTASDGASQKKKVRPGKKNNAQSSNPSPMTNCSSLGHGHSASQPNISSTLKDGTHYAGPTFHASPAPSALPIPTFFSKSVPDQEVAESPDGESREIYPIGSFDHTPTKPRATVALSKSTDEIPSPLDFLFKSAKGAKVASRPVNSETQSVKPSPPQPNLPSQAKATPREITPGAIFPLELESPDNRKMAIGPSFATPYKDRINALRSASFPSRANDNVPLDEGQRKAKTDALKDLLLNPRPQRPSSASPKTPNDSNIFGSRSSTPLARHSSGPPTPVPSEEPKGSLKGRSPDNGSIAHQYLSSVCNGTQSSRTPSSNLRRELSSTSSIDSPLLSTNGSQENPKRSQTYVNLTSPTPNRVNPHLNPAVPSPRSGYTPSKPLDAKQMEADLRRILKLDSNHSRG